MKKTTSGFTIVELLIVIVVIAILAAIGIVTYGGIKQRADNTATIDSASKTVRLIRMYLADAGSVPYTQTSCITSGSGCTISGSAILPSSTLGTNLAKIGTVSSSIPKAGSTHNGIVYYYNGARMVDGNPAPVVVLYWLKGTSQQCGVGGLILDPNANSTTLSTTGYTSPNDAGTGLTMCAVALT